MEYSAVLVLAQVFMSALGILLENADSKPVCVDGHYRDSSASGLSPYNVLRQVFITICQGFFP